MLKNELELVIGETYALKTELNGDVKWYSDYESVVKIDNNGIATGVSAGKTRVIAEAENGEKDTCTVYVVEKEYGFEDNIMISVFWPPTKDLVNDEQYKLMADAGITWIGYGDLLGDKETQMKMLQLSYKYGMRMMVNDSRFGFNLVKLSDKEIKDLVDEYRNVPGANGYYILDEPYNPNEFIKAYTALKKADPGAYMHLNFLPLGAYPGMEVYKSQMNDWLKLCEASGYHQDYLMYDMYPFGAAPDSLNYAGFLNNMEAVRVTGLKNDVKTATYIQSVCIPNDFRSLNREETLYEINMSLAFGMKQLSYFTWFTPHDRSQEFEDGIIAVDGTPNEKYGFVCEINKKVLNIGKTLINCDAYEVYESSKTYDSVIGLIPDDFFVHTSDASADFTVSYLRDKKAGRNYCMVVNNSFISSQRIELEFAAEINSAEYLSYDDGKLYPLNLDKNNGITLDFGAGDAYIIALPVGYDRKPSRARIKNLAREAQIYCDTSAGADGWYMDNLNNGKRFTTREINGWKTANDTGLGEIIIDLEDKFDFNRIDLYPASALETYGADMPTDFTVSYSMNRKNWKKIASASGFRIINKTVPSLKFKKVSGRYVKIDITGSENIVSSLCEIEIYNDDGSLPEPEFIFGARRGTHEIPYKEGENIALNKIVTASSAPGGNYRSLGWHPDFVCDGNRKTGWTSNVKAHMESGDVTEYCIIDLKDTFLISDINVYPADGGLRPLKFDLSVSLDLSEWQTVAKETGGMKEEGYSAKVDGIAARYVKFTGTKLTGNENDGYMLQISEIEVYGKPYKNTEEAERFIKAYISAGGNAESEECKAVKEALCDKNVTQSQLDKKLSSMLKKVGLSLQKEEAAEYDIKYYND